MNRVKFGIEHVGMPSQFAYVRIPEVMWGRNQAEENEWYKTVQNGNTFGHLHLKDVKNGGVEIGFDFSKTGRRRHPVNRRYDLARTTRVINGSITGAQDDERDERLLVYVDGLLEDGRTLGMDARVKLPDPDAPDVTDQAVTDLMTSTVQQSARQLKYMRGRRRERLEEWVHVNYQRQRGITIQTAQVGSCSLDTDGMEYDPDEETAVLYGHNLDSAEQQLICFTGLVALANASELL